MGHQFRFVMDECDEKMFFEYLQLENKVYIQLPFQNPIQIRTFPEGIWILYYIYNKGWGKLDYLKNSRGKYWIDPTICPVIEFSQTTVREEKQQIQRGRLYVEMKYWQDEQLIQKNELLYKMYKQFVNWIKKHLECVILQNDKKKTKEYVSKSLVQTVVSGYQLLG